MLSHITDERDEDNAEEELGDAEAGNDSLRNMDEGLDSTRRHPALIIPG